MILSILLYLLIFSLLLAVLLLCLPYRYQLSFDYDQEFYLTMTVHILFINLSFKVTDRGRILLGLGGLQIETKGFINRKIKQKIGNKKTEISKTKNSIDSKKSFIKGFPYKLITRDNLEHLLSFVIKLARKACPEEFRLKLLLGLPDPYYSGLILAYYYSIKGLYPGLPVILEIDWQEEVIKGQGRLAGTIIPAVFLYYLLTFILAPRTLKILWQLYRFKKG